MAKKQKFDGVVEAVHFDADGTVKWVRAYVRRGPTFSDRILIPRQELIETIKSGKSFLVGKRIPRLASTFDVSNSIRVIGSNDREVLVSGLQDNAERDNLDGVPVV